MYKGYLMFNFPIDTLFDNGSLIVEVFLPIHQQWLKNLPLVSQQIRDNLRQFHCLQNWLRFQVFFPVNLGLSHSKLNVHLCYVYGSVHR